MSVLIKAENLRKDYGKPVLDGVSLEVLPGEALGIFGRSGAGKSVLLRLLAGIERPDSGSVARGCGSVAYSPQHPQFDVNLTPMEALGLHAALCRVQKGKRRSTVREVLSVVGLDSVRDERIGRLTYGCRKLLEIAAALLPSADLLVLDDPVSGLDDASLLGVRELLLRLRARDGIGIVIATPRSEDAELCDTAVLLHRGRVLASGKTVELLESAAPEAVAVQLVREKARPGSKPPTVVSLDKKPVLEDIISQVTGNPVAVRMLPKSLDTLLNQLVESADGS